MENLTNEIKSAYISDGVHSQLAKKYSVNSAVNAIIKDCTVDSFKVVTRAGNFEDLDKAVQKFVESCTDATGKSDTLFHTRQSNPNYRRQNRGSARGNYRGNDRFLQQLSRVA